MLTSMMNEIRKMDRDSLGQWAEETIAIAKMHFKTCGEVAPVMLVIGTNPECDDMSLLHVVPLAEFLRNEQRKDLAAVVIPQVLKKMGAYALIKVIETWLVDTRDQKEVPFDEAMKQAEELKEKYGGSLENVPGRREAISVMFESQFESWMHTIEIIRDKDGKGTLGKEDRLVDDVKSSSAGRMVGWLDASPDQSELH